MAYSVADALAQYEREEAAVVPMRGRPGEVRRNPSTDQKKVRRQMTVQKKAADEAADPMASLSDTDLLRMAAKALTLIEQEAYIAEHERRVTAKMTSQALERSLDLSIKESVEIVPRGSHELHTASTDWLLAEGKQASASDIEAEQSLVAESSMWFGRVPDYVKEDAEEYGIQAANYARHIASQFGEHAEAAARAFVNEAARLHRLGQRTGAIKLAALVHDFDNGGMVDRPDIDPGDHASDPTPAPHQDPEHPGAPENAKRKDTFRSQTPHLDNERDRLLSGEDAGGVREMSQGYANSQVHGGLAHTASLHTERDTEDAHLSAVLAGMSDASPMADAENALDSSAQGVGDMSSQFAQQQVDDQDRPDQHMAASGLPQVGLPQAEFNTGGPVGYPPVDTSSERSPSLQEIKNFQGWNGTSVVPPGDSGAAAANLDDEGTQDHAGGPGGFPVSGAMTHAAKVAAQLTKESNMTEHRACPTCSGTGHVAVRKEAYSGLPQIDQIVNADETPGATPLPTDVAFPLTGWGQTPQQGQQNVQNTINETEQQLAERAGRSPLLSRANLQRTADAPDASGWMGAPVGPAPGGKGQTYPGYSAPSGYDGSNNLGQPDPVYGYGGDNGNQPLRPYGEEEANDVTNNPPEPFNYGEAHNNDRGQSTVSPELSTMGARDPFLAQAIAERARQDAFINNRVAMLQRQAG